MSTEAISAAVFIRDYTRELHSQNAAVFAGAGLSMDSGYVNWQGLLDEVIRDLGLDPAKEHDLVTIAQYHCNQAGGNRAHLTQAIFKHFAPQKNPTKSHRILARLPIRTYWTTNYDKLIEKSLEEAKKVPDVKYTEKQLTTTRLERDAVVYKMHGDIDHATEAVVSRDDYEEYPLKMEAFVWALRGDLVEKTFLFLGFSFTDPNIDYILSRVRVQYGSDQRPHYCVLRKVSRDKDESEGDFKYRELKQHYFIRDLKRFSILTVLVDEYADIPLLLERLAASYKRSSILVSGAAEEYGAWKRADAEAFLHNLSYQLLMNGNRVISGFGLGVGSAVINGALAGLNDSGKSISEEHLVLRPFPQVSTGGKELATQWTEYRTAMVDYAGISIFVFGNKFNPKGELVPSNGMREEFELSRKAGVRLLPVGATGYMAKELWNEMSKDLDAHHPNATISFKRYFELLGDDSKSPAELLDLIRKAIFELQRA
jgi:hypothetical protein